MTTSNGRSGLVTRWLTLAVMIVLALIGGTLYVASVRGDVQRLEDRQDRFEQTVLRELRQISRKLDEIDKHVRPFRDMP